MTWNKKLIVVTLILLSLFMISTVSAATDTTEDLVKSDVTHEEKISHTTDTPTDTSSNSENVADKSTDIVSEKKSISTNEKEEGDGELSSTPENNVLKADKKTFSELNKTISDAGNNPTEITLQHDYIQDTDSDIEIKNGQKITIQGNGHTLDAKGKTRIFTVNGELILKNLKLINGKINGDEAYGGAIFAVNSVGLTIINCTFINNTLTGTDAARGGAIFSNKANIINSTFTNNTATGENCGDGGAIFTYYKGTLTITNSNFIENNAGYTGGAIKTDDTFTLSVTNSNFIKNRATYDGGAIQIGNSNNATLTKCIFTKNTATYNGGAITVSSYSNVNITNTLFNQNNAQNGKGIYLTGTVEVKNSVFIKDNYYGGSINLDENTKTGINPGTFAALDAMINTCGFDTITLDENYKYNTTSGSPDSEFKDGTPITKKVTINGNGFTIDGSKKARIFNVTGDEVTLKNIIFINGYADEGGAIYLDGDLSNIENCTFINNQANIGGAILWSGSENDGYVSDCIFVNNSATRFGAVALPSGKSYVSACIFVNNSNKEDGVVGHAWDTYNYTEINNNIFLNNNATYDICLTGGNANLDYNWFEKNATNYMDNLPIAGTFDCNYWLFLNATPDNFILGETNEIVFKLDLYNKTSQKVVKNYNTNLLKPVKLTITNDNVDKKVALLGEPIKYNTKNTGIDNITASIENVKYTKEVNIISENTFTALYENITKSTEEITTITLKHNYTYDNTTDQYLQKGIIINKTVHIIGNGYTISGNNTARIFKVTNGGHLTLENITLTKGQGQQEKIPNTNDNNNIGGAIYANNAKLTLINTTLQNNTATDGFGGAIYSYDSQINITNSILQNNQADDAGGAIYTNKTYINITNSILQNNNATGTSNSNGGAISAWSNSQINITNSILQNNTAMDGGAIYIYKTHININNSTLQNNDATHYGGAIYATKYSETNISSSLFIDNNANNAGSAIFGYSFENLTVNHNIFLNKTGNNIIYLDNYTTPEHTPKFEYNLDYNWFGHNATDYTTINGISGGTLNNWLFLNATAKPDLITVLSSSDVSFELFLYNSSSDNVTIYDNSQLKPVNLTLTSVNGNVTNNTVRLGESTIYTTKVSGIGSVTASIYGVSYTQVIKAIKDTSYTALYNNITQSTDPTTIITLTQDYIYDPSTDTEFQDGIIINKTVIIRGDGHSISGNNTAAIFQVTENGNLTLENITLTNGNGYEGGAISVNNGNLTIINTTLTNNTADEGGAIFAAASNVTIINTTFTNNSATYDGGAIYAGASNLSITNTTMTNNTAGENGGAIATDNAIETNIIDSTFTQNNATQWGGAIYTNSDLTVQNSLFQDNNANRGSGVYIDNALFTSKNNTFINNTVDGENYKIRPIDPQIKIENIDDTVEGNPITITITAYDEFNTDLVLSLNGNNYTVKMINGNGQISISDLKPGTYTATIQFNGNDDYTNTTVTSNTFKVNTKPTPTPSPNTNPTVNPSKKTVYKVKIYLTLKKVKKVSKKTRKLYLKVIVKRNGKKLLTKKITLKVKRNKVKAKKTNKNKAKSKKLSKVQGFKFTVKIKGKTYTKKTNKKGKATYTITNLYKKGTYKAKIRYKSKYYKKNGKTIKFKIKK